MKVKISYTVKDVFNHLSDSKNFIRILNRAEENFIKKHTTFECIADLCTILYVGMDMEEEQDLRLGNFDLIMWENLTFEERLDFFIEDPFEEDVDEYQALDFKKFFVQSLQEDLNSLMDKLIDHVKFFCPLELK